MWIRRLKVTDCAGIVDASVDLERGLNVLHGPNEIGKSSLVEAVRAVLLLQSGSSAAQVLADWHGGGPPRVALTFEREGQVWRVRKTFRKGGGQAFLEYSRDGRDFSTDSRGREVDGRLNEMLGWGAVPPGGRGGPRGMPSTLITTALLGRQDEVAAILDGSLADDPTESGREQLMRALEGLAEDPRLKNLLAAVQEKVDLAYTATGRRRSGRASPWTQLKEERRAAEEARQEVRSQRDESESVRRHVRELQWEQTEAEARRDAARRALEEAQAIASRHDELAQARAAFRAAREQAERIESLIRTCDEKLAAAEAERGQVTLLSSRQDELKRAAERCAEQLAEARERARDLESGAGEQERRLRQEEARNRLLEADRALDRLERRTENARRLGELDRQVRLLDDRIEERKRNLARSQARIEEAERSLASARRRLQELRVERLGARCLAARDDLKRRAREHEAAQRHASAAAAAEDEAASLRKEADALRAPSTEEIGRLNRLESHRRIAREKLAVGLVADLELQPGATAEVRTDRETEVVRVGEGRHADVEARRELRVDFPGVGVVRVRGGGKELVAAADAAEREAEAARRPLLDRAGAVSKRELEDLHRQAERLRADAEERDRMAAEARVRAEGLEDAERERALARGALDRSLCALAEALDQGIDQSLDQNLDQGLDRSASVEEYIRGLVARPREESELVGEMRKAERRVLEFRDRRRGLESKLEHDARDLDRDRQERESRRNDLSGADDFDWRGLLDDAAARGAELAGKREAAKSRLEAVRAEAAGQVEAARKNLHRLEQEDASLRRRRDGAAGSLAAQREKLAGLETEARVHQDALAHEDMAAARAERERRREILEELEEGLAGVVLADTRELERTAREAEAAVSRITADLQKRRGALEQVGGAYAEEQARQAEERVEAVRERESDLEVEYEAWKLLAETLREVEKQETAHLGKALVGPVSSRISELTGGRYGDVAIGPELDAGGVRFAGKVRLFGELSVGAREQIAILLRISIAEALGAFVVLDDQLTQTDSRRMAWLRELLEDAARRIQIVVLTCHPEDYGASPSAHVVDLASRVRRSDRGT